MIIKSILDTDLYKFTTSYAYMKLFPQAIGTFEFKDRDNTEYTEEFVEQLRIELYNLAQLRLTNDEFEFMNSIRFIPRHYWEWLSQFTFNPGKVSIFLDEEKHLHILVKDYLYKVTLYEVPILAMVSELRNRMLEHKVDTKLMLSKLESKIKRSNQAGIYFSEFGTRRRFSYNIQELVIQYIKEKSIYCTGTSNCYFAMKYDMKPMGTHPHEWFMFHGAMYGYKQANYMALENWVNVYDGDLGIALTDTYTSDVFIKNFSRKQAKLFDGVRQADYYVNKLNALKASIALTPTDGLGISNSDLDQIGAKSYSEVDDILQTLLPLEYWYNQQSDVLIAKEFNDATNILASKYSEDVVNKVWNRHLASEFKRKKAPIYILRKEYEND
jgi:nicotinate phosphoribosyltransferase|nr:MAG TPA: nicotinate phosphoribosyltransferase [Bacteriophage sp.]